MPCTEVFGVKTIEMADTLPPPSLPRELITHHDEVYGIMFRVVYFQYLPVARESFATRGKMLLLWPQDVSTVRSFTYMCVRGSRHPRSSGQSGTGERSKDTNLAKPNRLFGSCWCSVINVFNST